MKAGIAIFALGALAACAEWGVMTDKSLVPDGTEERVKAAVSYVPATPQQKESFGILAQLPGRTMRGRPTQENAETSNDMQRWEWIENGTAISVRHALEDQSYGGHTVMRVDPATGALRYDYVTNAGFSSHGALMLNDDGRCWKTTEAVTGDSFVSQVDSTGCLNEDGTMRTSSRYLTEDGWQDGHGFIYYETFDPLPEVQTVVPVED